MLPALVATRSYLSVSCSVQGTVNQQTSQLPSSPSPLRHRIHLVLHSRSHHNHLPLGNSQKSSMSINACMALLTKRPGRSPTAHQQRAGFPAACPQETNESEVNTQYCDPCRFANFPLFLPSYSVPVHSLKYLILLAFKRTTKRVGENPGVHPPAGGCPGSRLWDIPFCTSAVNRRSKDHRPIEVI